MKLAMSNFNEKLKNKQLTKLVSSFLDSKLLYSVSEIEDKTYIILPGFCDVHVHFREPGFSYKETIKTGSASASRGGYTTVLTMPNLNPIPDTLEHLFNQLDIIKRDASIEVIPYGSITMGEKGEELSCMDKLSSYVCGFSDDGKGVQNGEIMERAMEKAKALNKIVACHCEDNSLLLGGYIHDGEYAKSHNHKGICSASEFMPIKRDIELVRKTNASYHICHISTKESVDIIRKAKAQGLDVTCETAPHYLILTDKDLREDGNFKMNPPVRSEKDRQALIDGIIDGTIDILATDHAPHTITEKSKGLKDSPFGIVGLETAFPLLYTYLVKTNVITIERLIQLIAINPRNRFSLEKRKNDFTVFEISSPYKIDSNDFLSMGRNTPFNDVEVYGKCVLTVYDGKVIFED